HRAGIAPVAFLLEGFDLVLAVGGRSLGKRKKRAGEAGDCKQGDQAEELVFQHGSSVRSQRSKHRRTRMSMNLPSVAAVLLFGFALRLALGPKFLLLLIA